jgi:hypothetical protein
VSLRDYHTTRYNPVMARPRRRKRRTRPRRNRTRRTRSALRSRRRRARIRRLRARPHRRAPRGWAEWPKERLLNLPLRDLRLRIQGTPLRPCIERLYRELRDRGIAFRPHMWLSNEWYVPDDVPGIAIPFYLAHPRLVRLERELMLEVEGGTREHCMKLLRHEAAHALANAYLLHRRKDWRDHFGRPSQKYPDTYLPQPYSKRYVVHLDNWYAQSHPHEDWAETFAVWLNPRSDWRNRYRDWPALKKLEYVDRLMQEINGRPAKIRNRREVEPLRSLKTTLREYYDQKRKLYGTDRPELLDRDLNRLFSDAPEHRKHELASRYLRRMRGALMDVICDWTAEHHYRVREVLDDMIQRCDELKLRVVADNAALKERLIAFLTATVVTKLHSGGFHIRV